MPRGKRKTSWSRDDAKRRRDAARRSREHESDEARAARLEDQRIRTKKLREMLTEEQRNVCLQQDRDRHRISREERRLAEHKMSNARSCAVKGCNHSRNQWSPCSIYTFPEEQPWKSIWKLAAASDYDEDHWNKLAASEGTGTLGMCGCHFKTPPNPRARSPCQKYIVPTLSLGQDQEYVMQAAQSLLDESMSLWLCRPKITAEGDIMNEMLSAGESMAMSEVNNSQKMHMDKITQAWKHSLSQKSDKVKHYQKVRSLCCAEGCSHPRVGSGCSVFKLPDGGPWQEKWLDAVRDNSSAAHRLWLQQMNPSDLILCGCHFEHPPCSRSRRPDNKYVLPTIFIKTDDEPEPTHEELPEFEEPTFISRPRKTSRGRGRGRGRGQGRGRGRKRGSGGGIRSPHDKYLDSDLPTNTETSSEQCEDGSVTSRNILEDERVTVKLEPNSSPQEHSRDNQCRTSTVTEQLHQSVSSSVTEDQVRTTKSQPKWSLTDLLEGLHQKVGSEVQDQPDITESVGAPGSLSDQPKKPDPEMNQEGHHLKISSVVGQFDQDKVGQDFNDSRNGNTHDVTQNAPAYMWTTGLQDRADDFNADSAKLCDSIPGVSVCTRSDQEQTHSVSHETIPSVIHIKPEPYDPYFDEKEALPEQHTSSDAVPTEKDDTPHWPMPDIQVKSEPQDSYEYEKERTTLTYEPNGEQAAQSQQNDKPQNWSDTDRSRDNEDPGAPYVIQPIGLYRNLGQGQFQRVEGGEDQELSPNVDTCPQTSQANSSFSQTLKFLLTEPKDIQVPEAELKTKVSTRGKSEILKLLQTPPMSAENLSGVNRYENVSQRFAGKSSPKIQPEIVDVGIAPEATVHKPKLITNQALPKPETTVSIRSLLTGTPQEQIKPKPKYHATPVNTCKEEKTDSQGSENEKVSNLYSRARNMPSFMGKLRTLLELKETEEKTLSRTPEQRLISPGASTEVNRVSTSSTDQTVKGYDTGRSEASNRYNLRKHKPSKLSKWLMYETESGSDSEFYSDSSYGSDYKIPESLLPKPDFEPSSLRPADGASDVLLAIAELYNSVNEPKTNEHSMLNSLLERFVPGKPGPDQTGTDISSLLLSSPRTPASKTTRQQTLVSSPNETKSKPNSTSPSPQVKKLHASPTLTALLSEPPVKKFKGSSLTVDTASAMNLPVFPGQISPDRVS